MRVHSFCFSSSRFLFPKKLVRRKIIFVSLPFGIWRTNSQEKKRVFLDFIINKKRISFKRFRLSYLIHIFNIYLTERKNPFNPLWYKGKVRIAKWHIFQGQVTHFSKSSDTFFKVFFWMKFVSLFVTIL